MITNKFIDELFIYIDESRNIFNSEKPYQIPLYQRAFAWEDRQIIQLIEDVLDCDSEKYFIGTLVVADKGNYFEVVDGQQRLTALFLILTYLHKKVPSHLCFACREKSNYTLNNIFDILHHSSTIDQDNVQESILIGMRVIEEQLSDKQIAQKLSEKLANVVMYRVVVPPHTDMNRYFETMNTRGEQLEQHDILKANLMSQLETEENRSVFAAIWDACRDMNGYIQMHFDTASRNRLFGSDWKTIPTEESIFNLTSALAGNESISMSSLITSEVDASITLHKEDGKDYNLRFESIIDFPYFLLHTMKVFCKHYELHSDDGKELYDSLLNDRKLLTSFDRVIKHGQIDGNNIDRKEFSKKFIFILLKNRILFDSYIIKREFVEDNTDGRWSLKTLNMYDGKPSYINSDFHVPYDRENTIRTRHKTIMMIQSALRVSYTSPKVMHWITKLMNWLDDDCNRSKFDQYCKVAEDIARESIKEGFFNDSDTGMRFRMGVQTPHIVFNYLDYLLWKRECVSQNKYEDFAFEFRNSVEHWYPRNPSESELKTWNDGGVDRFGNLCIIQRNVNSKFSNLPPEGKKVSFQQMIDKGSIKLRIMSSLTKEDSSRSGSVAWKESNCEIHEKEMLRILSEDCGISI